MTWVNKSQLEEIKPKQKVVKGVFVFPESFGGGLCRDKEAAGIDEDVDQETCLFVPTILPGNSTNGNTGLFSSHAEGL